MISQNTRWVGLPARLALTTAMAVGLASVSLPASNTSAQTLAIPACAEIFELDIATAPCLRVVNAGAETAGPVDVYVGDVMIAEGIEYGQATEFAAIPGDSQQIRVVPAGVAMDDSTVDLTEDLQPGGAYQLTVSGLTSDDLSSWLSGVDVTPLPEDQARVRVVHASPDLGEVDVAVASDGVPFEGIELGNQSGYVPFEAGAFTFQVRQAGQDTLLLENPEPLSLEPGMNYDVYVMGQSEDGTLAMVVYAAEVGFGLAGDMTTADVATPVLAVGDTPIEITPGEQTPAADPEA